MEVILTVLTSEVTTESVATRQTNIIVDSEDHETISVAFTKGKVSQAGTRHLECLKIKSSTSKVSEFILLVIYIYLTWQTSLSLIRIV